MVWYNKIVKKFIAITTICAAMLCTGTYITASAENTEGITIPDSFSVEMTFDSVTDYAVGNGEYAFASGKNIYVYTVNASESSGYNYVNGEVDVYEHTSAILALEYKDGKLYFSDGATYLYSDGTATAADFEFSSYSESDIPYDGDYWYYINGNDLAIYNRVTYESTPYSDATYSKLKYINSCYYVLKNNTLCALSGGILSVTSFSYEDYENIEKIATNGTAQALGESKNVQVASVAAGSCIIRVDEDYLDGDYFTFLESNKINIIDESITAQVLYYPDGGNAALIAVGTKTYLTLKDNLTVSNYSAAAVSSQSYYLLDGASVYVIPYANEFTTIAQAEKDAVVTVSAYVSDDEFDYNYYKVEYTDANGETVSGYIIANLLTPYTFDNDNGESQTVSGGDQSEENDIFTITLVMVIVVLVLIAVGYLTFVATSDKKKRRK